MICSFVSKDFALTTVTCHSWGHVVSKDLPLTFVTWHSWGHKTLKLAFRVKGFGIDYCHLPFLGARGVKGLAIDFRHLAFLGALTMKGSGNAVSRRRLAFMQSEPCQRYHLLRFWYILVATCFASGLLSSCVMGTYTICFAFGTYC